MGQVKRGRKTENCAKWRGSERGDMHKVTKAQKEKLQNCKHEYDITKIKKHHNNIPTSKLTRYVNTSQDAAFLDPLYKFYLIPKEQ